MINSRYSLDFLVWSYLKRVVMFYHLIDSVTDGSLNFIFFSFYVGMSKFELIN